MMSGDRSSDGIDRAVEDGLAATVCNISPIWESLSKGLRVSTENSLNAHLTCNGSPRESTNERSKETVGERDTTHTARNIEA